MANLASQFQQFNVFRRPSWRYDRVVSLQADGRRCSRRDDQMIKIAKTFFDRWQRAAAQDRESLLFEENPGLWYAVDIHTKSIDEPEPAMFIQARLLAGQSIAHIAHAMGTIPETIEWYEALFFHVTDRLHNRDWITKHVLLPSVFSHTGNLLGQRSRTGGALLSELDSIKRGAIAEPFLDASLKFFAYFGGTHLIDVMINGFQAGKPLNSQDDMAAWFDENWSMCVRRRSCQAILRVEVNRYNVMELFAIHTRIMELDRAADTDDSKRTAHERHVKALMDQIPWTVGEDGRDILRGTKLGERDEGAVELRDDEVQLLAAGYDVPIDEKFPKQLPPPRRARQVKAEVESNNEA